MEHAKEDEENYLYSIKYAFGVTRLRKVAERALEILHSVIEFFAPVQSGTNEHVSWSTPLHIINVACTQMIEEDVQPISVGYCYNMVHKYNIKWKSPFFFCDKCYDKTLLDEQLAPLTSQQQQRYRVCYHYLITVE